MKRDKCIYGCQDMSAKHYWDSITKIQTKYRTHRTPTSSQHMEQKFNMLINLTTPQNWTRRAPNTFSKLQGHSCITDEQLTSPSSRPLSSIASEQAAPTEQTMAKVKQLLDYCASQEEAIITYNASKMVLAVHSDAGYANEKRQEAMPGDISSYQIMIPTHQTMEQY